MGAARYGHQIFVFIAVPFFTILGFKYLVFASWKGVEMDDKEENLMAGTEGSVPFTREQLYEEVWSTPMKHIGIKYGLSGPSVRRACDDLQVPVPAQGHWTRVQMGHVMQRPPLPAMVERHKTADVPSPGERHAPRRKRIELSLRLSQESSPAPVQKQVFEAPTRWHSAIGELRARCEKSAANAIQMKKRDEWEQAHPGKRCPPHLQTSGSWEYFCDAGQLLVTSHRKSVARLSLTSYQRGLALLNAVCYRAEAAGYSARMGKENSRIELSRDGVHVELRISEKLNSDFRQRVRSWDKKPEQVKRLTPSGRLVLFVEEQGGGATELADKPGKLLEQQMDQLSKIIDVRYAGSLETVALWARQKQEREDAEIRRQEEERVRKEAQLRAEQERARRHGLIAEAEDWNKAEMLHAYIAMLDRRVAMGGAAMESYPEWREWVLVVANELDRSATRVEPVARLAQE
jgi:hypothetical protein